MIELNVPLFPIAGLTGVEKIFAAIPPPNPAMSGDIQAVTYVVVVHWRHVLEQRVHVARWVDLSPIGISWAAGHDGVGAIRIRGTTRKRQAVAKDAGILDRAEIRSWNSCL